MCAKIAIAITAIDSSKYKFPYWYEKASLLIKLYDIRDALISNLVDLKICLYSNIWQTHRVKWNVAHAANQSFQCYIICIIPIPPQTLYISPKARNWLIRYAGLTWLITVQSCFKTMVADPAVISFYTWKQEW